MRYGLVPLCFDKQLSASPFAQLPAGLLLKLKPIQEELEVPVSIQLLRALRPPGQQAAAECLRNHHADSI